MRLPTLTSLLSLSLSALLSSASASSTLSTEIYYWPLSSSSSDPSSLAKISYDPSTLHATVDSYTPPTDTNTDTDNSNDLLRIGLYKEDSSQFVSTLTSLSLFSNNLRHHQQQNTLLLHLDQNNKVYHATLIPSTSSDTTRAATNGNKNSGKNGENTGLKVEFVRSSPSPNPHLNRPVVLNADGNAPEEVVEKTFFQKYWWALALIGVLAFTGSAEN
ncbi:hypothetical protein AJ79_08183 [Helicocarpus griseus UAMH5409]|uniref:ER membrane protein complex subunit 10 n=1 Tax=Helicocarpus griseus UAMH5409 TaxID=1447875 RepID=A0A2B7WVG9_9EURO|nr:hypothetical protein AJ79_08183 [Helicocarpus griseus UAMH5409]